MEESLALIAIIDSNKYKGSLHFADYGYGRDDNNKSLFD